MRREQWLEELPRLDPAHLVFIDESGAKTNMTRQRGRAMEGNRLFAKAPHGHWGTTTLISSVRLNGATAAMEIAGATDSEVFREYVRRILAPTLSPGDLAHFSLFDRENANFRTLSVLETTDLLAF